MFNILMAGRFDDWVVPLDEDHNDEFPLSRYLEYTDIALADRLKPVSNETLATVAELPALFMSELFTDEDGESYVSIRLGRIANPRVARNNIAFSFRIQDDFGKVPVEDRSVIEEALELGRWELTRTHWAVKDGNLDEALQKLGLVGSIPISTAAPAALNAVMANEPEKLIADSLESYLQIVLGDDSKTGDDVFYRGHADHSYKLEPSLFRTNADGEPLYLRSEAAMVREMLTAHPAEFLPDPYMIDRLVRMQHYGLPTRLLDVTSNPLVGLYFCCSGVKYDTDGNEIDGEVIVLSTPGQDIKFFDSDTVSCIANLAMLEEKHKRTMKTDLDVDAFNASPEASRLLHIIKAEKPYFKPCINPADLNQIVFIKGRNANARIASQSGAFLLFGHDALLPETGHSNLNVRRITIRNKARILKVLHQMNIKSSTIYPGIEKTSAEIAKHYENAA